jgi:prepilin-type N-terminal cleavage/methylation domain-containing protein
MDMPMRRGSDRRDAGFTLSELLVAVVLFVVALGVAYTALSALTQANEVAIQESTFAREVTYPIDQFQKMAMQNDRIQYADGYRFEFWDDLHNNNTPDLVSFWADSSGKFYKSTQRYNLDRVTTTWAASTAVLSAYNANVAMGTPLFVYYSRTGAVIISTSTVPANADRVGITIVAKYRAKTMESFSMVTFRNRTY